MYDALIASAARTYNVPDHWIRAVILTESSGDPNAYRAEPARQDASYGLMQLLGSTARALGFTGQVTALYDPAVNIDLGTKLLSQLRQSHGDDFRRIYSAYNSGRPDKYLEDTKIGRQVAANVARAVAYLESLGGSAAAAAAENPGVVLVLIAALAWAWMKKF